MVRMVRSFRHPKMKETILWFMVCEDTLLGASFFPLRLNLNLRSRDSCPYTDKGCMDSREEKSQGGPLDCPDPTKE